MNTRHLIIPTLALLAASGVSHAADSFQIHGFASQGYFVTTHNDFLSQDSEGTGSFDQTEAGLNVVATPIDRLRVGIQVTASDMGEYGNMRPQIDWAFGEYEVSEVLPGLSMQVTGGRFKSEYGFYNEYRDLDMTRSTVFLPFTIYDPRFREAYLSLNGAQVKFGADLKAAGTVDLSLRFGNAIWDSHDSSVSRYFDLQGLETTDISSDYVYGGALTWNTPVEGLRARFSYLGAENLQIDANLPGGVGTLESLIQHYHSGVFGVEWQISDFTFVGEVKKTYFKTRDTYGLGAPPALFLSDDEVTDEEGAYLSAAWRFHPQLEAVVGGQWAMNDPDGDNPPPPIGSPVPPFPERQHHRSINLALCWNVTDHWLIKAEAMWADGTLLIAPAEQQDTDGIQENWSLYSIKTTYDF